MADRLTQLQDCYDQLATQFYASIRYLSLHHNSSALTPPPPSHPQRNHNNNSTSNANANSSHDQPTSQQEQPESSACPPEQRPDTPITFASAQRELAQDLLLKTKQIEYVIGVLPGVENSRQTQEARITELDAALRIALVERAKAEEERELWLGKVDGIIGGIKR